MKTRKAPKYELALHHYLSRRMKQLMDEHEPPLSVKETAERMGCAMENVRRIVADGKTTSDATLEDFAEALNLPNEVLEELLDLNMRDKFEIDYGSHISLDGSGVPAVLANEWAHLKPKQKKEVTDLIYSLVEKNLPPAADSRKNRVVRRH